MLMYVIAIGLDCLGLLHLLEVTHSLTHSLTHVCMFRDRWCNKVFVNTECVDTVGIRLTVRAMIAPDKFIYPTAMIAPR